MKLKRFILLVATILCLIGGTMPVFADETTTQVKEELPSETIIVNNDTYILDEKINNKNICEKYKISIGNHTYYKLKATQNENYELDTFLWGFAICFLIMSIIIFCIVIVVDVINSRKKIKMYKEKMVEHEKNMKVG